MNDEFFMKRALQMAKKGAGYVSPNPMVGCVIVKNNKIISEDYHRKYGEFHAERNAILKVENKDLLKGSTLYVTLEPCCHYGKTPPCTEIIIQSGIKRVVIGCSDYNPIIFIKGIEILKKSGIEVTTFVLEDECRNLNKVFFYYIRNKTPFVVMKYAMTLDGKIATYCGNSKWITNQKSREIVHKIRNDLSAIMVGIETVLKDDPTLDCRLKNGVNPIRIVCDSNLKIPIDCTIVKTAESIKTYIACLENNNIKKIEMLERKGVKIIITRNKNGKIDLNELMIKLGELEIDSVLLEGGSTLNYSALESGIVNKIYAFIAPKIFGGRDALSPVGGAGISEVCDSFKFKLINTQCIDNDVMIEYERGE